MRYTVIAKALLTIGLATASPIADRDQPITDVEYGRIADLGLSRRDSASLVKRVTDQPITSEEYARIADMGLSKRSNAIEARDSRSNCGQTITGDQVGGNGVWCPVDQYYTIVDEFCTTAAGTDVHIGHETSDTYGVTLSNQKDSSAPGAAGNVVFAIYNTKMSPTYVVNHDDCVTYMSKQSNTDSKCYGSKNKDTEGGYWKVDSVGLFGSEVYVGAPPS